MAEPIYVRVPSTLQKPLIVLFAFGSLASLWFGISSFSDGDGLRGATGLAAGLGLFGANYLVRYRFGNVIEITEAAISERRRGGHVRIAWAEPHQLETYDMRQHSLPGG